MQQGREFPFTQSEFKFLSKIINNASGIMVGDDKFNMFYSRLSRRLRILGLSTFRDYCDVIKRDDHGDERVQLINAITTNLTAFFREQHHFSYLSESVIPELVKQNVNRTINIWSSGCSTGEEPYSLAMTFNESMMPKTFTFNILATDLDSNVLQTAQAGIYPMSRVEGLDTDHLKKWFFKGKSNKNGFVKVKEALKENIVFSQLNLMDNWKVGIQDIIFCRNVIIYFDKKTKMRLIDQFADCLKLGGYLFIGHSETMNKLSERFELVGHTIYRKIK